MSLECQKQRSWGRKTHVCTSEEVSGPTARGKGWGREVRDERGKGVAKVECLSGCLGRGLGIPESVFHTWSLVHRSHRVIRPHALVGSIQLHLHVE